MKNTRGEPSAGGQTAPRETLPISCLFVLFRSLRVVRAANIVTMDVLRSGWKFRHYNDVGMIRELSHSFFAYLLEKDVRL